MKRHLLQILLPAAVALGVVVLPAATAGAQGDEPRRGRPSPTPSVSVTTGPTESSTPAPFLDCHDLREQDGSQGFMPRVIESAQFDALAPELVVYEYLPRAGNVTAAVRLAAGSCSDATYELRLFKAAAPEEANLLQSARVNGDGTSGPDAPLVISSLISNLSVQGSDACVRAQLRVLGPKGEVMDVAPDVGTIQLCNGSGADGGTDGGGAQGFGG